MKLPSARVWAMLPMVVSMAACGDSVVEGPEPSDDAAYDGVVDATVTPVTVTAGRTAQVRVTNDAALATITINCAPPTNPDSVGLVFRVTAPDLGIANANSQPARAGYFSWTGVLRPSTYTVSITGVSGSGTCRVSTGAAAGTCARTMFRSPNTNHAHFRVGADTSADWEAFPVSGNHWGAWPAWNHAYTRPVLRGYLLHALEHGGLVLSYKCAGPSESSECGDQATQLTALAQRFGNHRVIITPDPTQPTTFAIRAWRWGYTADCLDEEAALIFLRGRYRHGREDVDADPPIPFDPSTTNVPCQDIAAAPDSC